MSKGRILFLQRVFPPDAGAAGEILGQLADYLARNDWNVEVVCAGNSRTPVVSSESGFFVHRVPAVYSRKNLVIRALSAWQTGRQIEAGARNLTAPDIVISLTDPPGMAVIGQRVARHHGAAHVHWSQDVYPEIAWRLGAVARWNPLARRLGTQMNAALRDADAVISIGRCMTELLVAQGIPAARIQTVPNWAATPGIGSGPAMTERPMILYSGNLGLAHEFTTLLEIAARTPRWDFWIAGQGPRFHQVEAALNQRPVPHVKLLTRQTPEEYAVLRNRAAVHCVTLDPRVADCVVPSKAYAALRDGRPLFYIGPEKSDLHLLAQDAGISIRNGDAVSGSAALEGWRNDPELWQAAATRAAELSTEYTLAKSGRQIEEELRNVLIGRGMKPC